MVKHTQTNRRCECVWVCLTILWGLRLKGEFVPYYFYVTFSSLHLKNIKNYKILFAEANAHFFMINFLKN